jgi:hypothetical protein
MLTPWRERGCSSGTGRQMLSTCTMYCYAAHSTETRDDIHPAGGTAGPGAPAPPQVIREVILIGKDEPEPPYAPNVEVIRITLDDPSEQAERGR